MKTIKLLSVLMMSILLTVSCGNSDTKIDLDGLEGEERKEAVLHNLKILRKENLNKSEEQKAKESLERSNRIDSLKKDINNRFNKDSKVDSQESNVSYESDTFEILIQGDRYEVNRKDWEEFKLTDTYKDIISFNKEYSSKGNSLLYIEQINKIIDLALVMDPNPSMEVIAFTQCKGYFINGKPSFK